MTETSKGGWVVTTMYEFVMGYTLLFAVWVFGLDERARLGTQDQLNRATV